ncbi:MAG: glycosyltransferase family 2 protein [Methanomicrobiaceae archaeon]|nr:glycosyltransferase family 2 protein [Methanomicrobiaceae archaeon]
MDVVLLGADIEGLRSRIIAQGSVIDEIQKFIELYPESKIHSLAALPAYNEEKYIAKTILGAKKHVDLVVVIDDFSSDTTAEIAEALGAMVIHHDINTGYGGALRTIFNTARELGVEKLVTLDAEWQHNPDEIPKLLAPLNNGSDIVIGSRFLEGYRVFSEQSNKIPKYRKFGMKILDVATNFAGELSVSDSQSGYRAYGKKAIRALQIQGNGMSAGSEILVQVNDHGLNVQEVPINVRYDIEDTSSQQPLYHGLDVLRNLISLITIRKPMWFFGIPAVILATSGISSGIWVFPEYYHTYSFHYIVFIGSVTALILGSILATCGPSIRPQFQ